MRFIVITAARARIMVQTVCTSISWYVQSTRLIEKIDCAAISLMIYHNLPLSSNLRKHRPQLKCREYFWSWRREIHPAQFSWIYLSQFSWIIEKFIVLICYEYIYIDSSFTNYAGISDIDLHIYIFKFSLDNSWLIHISIIFLPLKGMYLKWSKFNHRLYGNNGPIIWFLKFFHKHQKMVANAHVGRFLSSQSFPGTARHAL